jgi:four helix bundle protein
LHAEFLDRVERFADRVLDVTDALESKRVSRRIMDQIAASGTSVGANTFEADEAMSRKDFCKALGIANKELNETRFWLRLFVRREWLAPARLADLLTEAEELKKILGAMIAKTRTNDESSDEP